MQEGSAAEVCHPQRSEVYPSLGRGAQNKDQEVMLMGCQKAPGQVLLPTVKRQKLSFYSQRIPSGRTMMFFWMQPPITRRTFSTLIG